MPNAISRPPPPHALVFFLPVWFRRHLFFTRVWDGWVNIIHVIYVSVFRFSVSPCTLAAVRSHVHTPVTCNAPGWLGFSAFYFLFFFVFFVLASNLRISASQYLATFSLRKCLYHNDYHCWSFFHFLFISFVFSRVKSKRSHTIFHIFLLISHHHPPPSHPPHNRRTAYSLRTFSLFLFFMC